MKRQLLEEPLRPLQKAVLESLGNHWEGLTVFVDRPDVPMDNNAAERRLRNPVTGRKAYYGSGSQWSAKLASLVFTVLQTVLLWGLNPNHWLGSFLQACAEQGGRSPSDLSAFLPWEMGEERKRQLAAPPPPEAPGPQQVRAPPAPPAPTDAP